MLDCVMKCSFS